MRASRRVAVYWGPRWEEQRAVGARLTQALNGLRELDRGLEDWWLEALGGNKPQPLESTGVQAAIRAHGRDQGAVRVAPRLCTGRPDNVQCELELVFGTAPSDRWRGEGLSLRSASKRLAEPSTLERILVLFAEAFAADWGFVGSDRNPFVAANHDGSPVIGAISYLSRAHGAIDDIPSFASKRDVGAGSVLRAVDEPFDDDSLPHWEAITRLSFHLERLGVRRSRYAPPLDAPPPREAPAAVKAALQAIESARAAMEREEGDFAAEPTSTSSEASLALDATADGGKFRGSPLPFDTGVATTMPKAVIQPSLEQGATAPLRGDAPRGATPFQADAVVHGMTVDAYARFCAECAIDAARLDEVLRRHMLSAESRAALDEAWHVQFAKHPAARGRWQKVFAEAQVALRKERRG